MRTNNRNLHHEGTKERSEDNQTVLRLPSPLRAFVVKLLSETAS